MEEITEVIDRGDDVDLIYLDFQKAFDKVPHNRLLIKLRGYGIKGKLYAWIKKIAKGSSKWRTFYLSLVEYIRARF